ncbi:VanZ family protein [Thiorhodococcus minor]|uniref:VanZ family protein n=1 Tax=Thiorhodococcus minor TaxID=57489 RepID=A0A6M0JUK8_9GAMM|nr:VanZ family protein [Thiorhodococcus minor]NEV61228.1 VanZ family protein [Thiorhodococcus minor]
MSRLFRPLAKTALAICVLAVAYLAFAPLETPPGFSYDKGNHLLAFFVMAWLADIGWPGRRYELPRWRWLLAYGLLIELVQRGLPFREFSSLDLLADALGIGLYVLLRLAAERLWLKGRGESAGPLGVGWLRGRDS